MSYKSENWKEKLEQVRAHVQLKEGSVEKSADEILNDQIEEELATFFQEDEIVEDNLELDEKIVGTGDAISKIFKTKDKKEIDGIANLMNMTSLKVLQSMQKQNPKGFKRMAAKLGELPAMEEVQEEVQEESVEKTIEKLAERNMLGRLAKQLQLNEQGKEQLFNYFEKGELKQ
tara:strand:- start:9338 stop:9859 length:522 start_codon:yes stop_codon:yes gene_type:complete